MNVGLRGAVRHRWRSTQTDERQVSSLDLNVYAVTCQSGCITNSDYGDIWRTNPESTSSSARVLGFYTSIYTMRQIRPTYTLCYEWKVTLKSRRWKTKWKNIIENHHQLTNAVATLSGKVFARMAKLAVKSAAAPRASTIRTSRHIAMYIGPSGNAYKKLKKNTIKINDFKHRRSC